MFVNAVSFKYKGTGGAALNSTGSIVAIVDTSIDAVHFFSMPAKQEPARLLSTFRFPEEPFKLRAEHLCFTTCFPETLLIADFNNDRVVEVTTEGKMMRSIPLNLCGGPRGIAFDRVRRLIAVSLTFLHVVVFLDYESGAMSSCIGTMGLSGRADGQFSFPNGVRFTDDHLHVLVADALNHRVSKYAIDGSRFVCHVASEINEISVLTDMVETDDDLLIADDAGRVTRVSGRGVTEEIIDYGRGLVCFLSGPSFVYVKDKVGEIKAVCHTETVKIH